MLKGLNEQEMMQGYIKMGTSNTAIAEEMIHKEVEELNNYEDFLNSDISDYIAAYKNLNS